jgi:4-hydroxy-3-methylbut-2-enyl diphosphate reductase
VIGTLGHAPGGIALVQDVAEAETVQPPDPDRVALLTQTTLSVDETEGIVAVLRRRFPNLREPARSDICYATTNRQAAVKELAREVDVVVVVGSRNSSNSLRLRDAAADAGKAAYLVDDPADVEAAWFTGAPRVGVTAGASSPEALVERVIAAIEHHTGGPVARAEIGSPEPEIVFAPPKALLELRALRGTA